MAVSPMELYHTEFVRSARAVGVLWGVCTLCLAVIEVVILVQPSWVVTTETTAPTSGTLGLFQVCVEVDWPGPDCQGSPSPLTPLPAFQTPAVLVCVSLGAVWCSAVSLVLFRFCHSATVYKSCGWLQLTAGACLSLACLLFLDSWDCAEMRSLCGDRVGSFRPGSCSVSWVFTLALLGVVDAVILATLAFVLANRQDALLPPETKEGNQRCWDTDMRRRDGGAVYTTGHSVQDTACLDVWNKP
ncbi:unnamed protein product [Merluccius merluccius]